MATYILCPGQGAQTVGMGRELIGVPAARALFDQASAILGFDLTKLCLEGPEERLNQTDASQPALFVVGAAAFATAGISLETVDGLAGLSLGEYTALHLAGVFSFEDGVKLVAARGRYMQEAAVATPSGMVALLGAQPEAADHICSAAAQGEVLVAANYNAPGQIVLSGAIGACQRAVEVAEANGLRATPLKVAGAFHSPLMQSAADHMRQELERVEFRPPQKPVWSNVTAQPHEEPASIKKLLVRQIVAPVRWEPIMRELLVDEAVRCVELPPGRTLAGLVKRINRRANIESLAIANS